MLVKSLPGFPRNLYRDVSRYDKLQSVVKDKTREVVVLATAQGQGVIKLLGVEFRNGLAKYGPGSCVSKAGWDSLDGIGIVMAHGGPSLGAHTRPLACWLELVKDKAKRYDVGSWQLTELPKPESDKKLPAAPPGAISLNELDRAILKDFLKGSTFATAQVSTHKRLKGCKQQQQARRPSDTQALPWLALHLLQTDIMGNYVVRGGGMVLDLIHLKLLYEYLCLFRLISDPLVRLYPM